MDDIIVTIEQGALRGKLGTDYDGRPFYSFLGIPYAKPPVGELRFKAPQAPEKWTGVRDATKDGSECYNRNMLLGTLAGSEDCLFINVNTPELPKDNSKLKPVMVWIHGGGYIEGSNSSNLYGPEFLVTGEVVVVSINYRLGVLGFLVLDDPKLEIPGNAGCKDMVMALKWVQSNIKHFGGDHNNVTIFGESAGGASVHLLMLSPMAKGLFHKVIAQSGCALNPWAIAYPCAKELAQILEHPYDDEAEFLRFLRSLPFEKVYEAQQKLKDQFVANIVRPLGPVVEKISQGEPAFLSEDPVNILLQGKYHKVPLMMGYTSSEGMLFIELEKMSKGIYLPPNFEEQVPHFLQLETGSTPSKKIADKIKAFYYGNEEPTLENADKDCLLRTDNFFLHGIYNSIKIHAATSTEPLYLYRFSADTELNLIKKFLKVEAPGASHGDELSYLFKTAATPDKVANSVEDKTLRRMVQLWTNFAKTSDPNPVDGVIWKPVRKNEINFLDIGTTLRADKNPEPERMQFWDDIWKWC